MSKRTSAETPDLFSSSDFPNIEQGHSPLERGPRQLANSDVPKQKRLSTCAQSQQLSPALEPDYLQLENEKYLTDKDVAARFGVSRPTIWRWTHGDLGFPQPVQISRGTTRWRLSDILQFEQQFLKHGRDFKPVQRDKRKRNPRGGRGQI